MTETKPGPGRLKKPVPIKVLERIHELRSRPPHLSERAATENAIQQFSKSLPGRPFERVRKAYREFKRQIGDRSLDDFRFERSYSARLEGERAQEARHRAELELLESQAFEVLGTRDLGKKNLDELYIKYNEARREKAHLDVLHGALHDRVEALVKLRGKLPLEEATRAHEQIRVDMEQAEERRDLVAAILSLRQRISEFTPEE